MSRTRRPRPASSRSDGVTAAPGWPTALLLAGSLLLTACAPGGLLRYRPSDPPLVSLPVEAAGVGDRRQPFARLFERELQATRPGSRIDDWLHGIAPAAAGTDEGGADLDARFAVRRAGTSVLVVPGLFGDCVDDQSVPFGDGRRRARAEQREAAYAGHADLGLHGIRLIPLPGRRSSEFNGRVLAEEIRREAARPGVERIVLVAYSKGTVDAQLALAELHRAGQLPRRLALVSVVGPVLGTPLADHFEALYDAVSGHVDPFGCSPSDGAELASITRRERLRWLQANPPVPGPRYHSVVAHASASEMAAPLQLTHALLRRQDPHNDGQVLAADAVLPNGTLLAVARSDHWDVALPRDRHPDAWVRSLASGRAYPREALFRALIRWAVADGP